MGLQSIVTVLVPAASDLLIDLPTVKTELNIGSADTSNDAWLTLVIGQVTSSIESFCNRKFAIEQVQDLIYMEWGSGLLELSRWPLVNFALVPLAAPAQPGDTELNFGSGYEAAAALPGVLSGPGLAAGSTFALSGAALTLNQPVAAAMAAGAPIAIGIEAVQAITAPVGLQPTGLSGGGALAQNVLAASIDYGIDARKGFLTRLNPATGTRASWEARPTTITYSAGYAAIPADVVVAALRWIAWRWYERGRDPTLKSIAQPMAGTESFGVGGPPMSGGVPAEIADLLSHYRVPVVA